MFVSVCWRWGVDPSSVRDSGVVDRQSCGTEEEYERMHRAVAKRVSSLIEA